MLAAAVTSVAAAATRGPAARAEAIISQLEGDPAAKGASAEAVTHARKALNRARGARDANDREHAAMLDDLALEWVELGRDSVRATQAEAQADAIERELQDSDTKIVRARALLEETIARRGRAREKLDQLEAPSRPPSTAKPPAQSKPAPSSSATPQKAPAAPKPGGAR